MNRDMRNRFGSHDYAQEELRVEIATAMIGAELDIPDHDLLDSASYIAEWLERLRSDRKEIFRAAAEAQRIADYLLAFHPAYAEGNDLAGAAEDAGKDAPDGCSESVACVAEAA